MTVHSPKHSHHMLAAAAYSEAVLPSLRLARSSRIARRVGRVLLTLLIGSFVLAALAPWQQAVTGNGNVVAFSPGERSQNIEVPVKGRVVRWGDGVVENAHVKKGDLIAEIQDIDPELINRLEMQVQTTQAQINSTRQLLEASIRNRDAARQVVTSLKSQLQTYRTVKEQIVASADAAVAAARNKIEAEQKTLEGHQAALVQLKADFERQQMLFAENIVAEVKLQLAERKFRETESKVETARAYVASATNDLEGKQRDRNAKEQKAQVDIDYAAAALDKAIGDVAKAETEVAKVEVVLGKVQKTMLELETKYARQQNQLITAPFDGFLTSINANQGGQILKEGDVLCVIVPDTTDRAVQVWLDGNDAPLVDAGRHVRLQFEGWPAVQFAGWPSVAVGTFGGTVVSVDAQDDGSGRFRVLVRPDSESSQPWPNERYLRQGVQTHAWVLLEQVPLWYEVWRNMNGFPPVVTPDKGADKAKKPKLPK